MKKAINDSRISLASTAASAIKNVHRSHSKMGDDLTTINYPGIN